MPSTQTDFRHQDRVAQTVSTRFQATSTVLEIPDPLSAHAWTHVLNARSTIFTLKKKNRLLSELNIELTVDSSKNLLPDVANGKDLPKRVDKFYPNRPCQNGIVLPIIDNQGVTELFLNRLG
jgi:hypothetical protein